MISLTEAAQLIKQGKLVAFPTETVYGLGADATNQQACLAIYQAKNRPTINPLIIHVANLTQAKEYAIFNDEAEKLANLWPGPLTMVLPKKSAAKLAPCVGASLDTVAIRISSHPILQELIAASGTIIAAPSANKSGFLSSTKYEHVYAQFGSAIAIINNTAKEAIIGLESTIIDLSSIKPILLRPGFFSRALLSNILGKDVALATKNSKIKAPGMLLRHYAPKTKIKLNTSSVAINELGLNFGNSQLISDYSLNLSPESDLEEAAANLFTYLHQLDNYAIKNSKLSINIAPIPNREIGVAINDRLKRAAQN